MLTFEPNVNNNVYYHNDNKNNKHYLMLCELHNPAIHGKTESSDSQIETHYLVYDIFDPITKQSCSYLDDEESDNNTDEERDSDDGFEEHPQFDKLNDIITFLRDQYLSLSNNFVGNLIFAHPTIRNYKNIISKPNYIKPEIGQYILLPTQEAVAILKTFWLRIIQRKWKKVFTQRQQVIRNRLCISALYFRETTGQWPKECVWLPELRGMLSDIAK